MNRVDGLYYKKTGQFFIGSYLWAFILLQQSRGYNDRESELVRKVKDRKKFLPDARLKETFLDATVYLLSTISRNDTFDVKYGTETSDAIEPDDAGIDDDTVRKFAIRFPLVKWFCVTFSAIYQAKKILRNFLL